MSPWPVIGHEWATTLLAQAIKGPAGPSHAYLFTGLGQVGKTTLARAFAQARIGRTERVKMYVLLRLRERPCQCGLAHLA